MDAGGPSGIGAAARRAGIAALFGVPDSLMKDALAELEADFSPHQFVIAPNEGAAVAMAIGYHVATGKLPAVFMQNSGLGNALNPLISLADSSIYSIPMLLLVGWRGEVWESGHQEKDEPQHLRQGRVTTGQLDLIGIRHFIFEPGSDISAALERATRSAIDKSEPVAIVIRSGALKGSHIRKARTNGKYPAREEVIRRIAASTKAGGSLAGAPIVATTGMASRELYESRQSGAGVEGTQDFLTVGGMGHAISIATSIAKEMNPQRVICLDGDGAALMHMGAMLHSAKQENLIHVILDNGVHDSVGGQPTGFREIGVNSLASAFGYSKCVRVETLKELSAALIEIMNSSGSTIVHALCEPGHRKDLGRPTATPQDSKQAFMGYLESIRGMNRGGGVAK